MHSDAGIAAGTTRAPSQQVCQSARSANSAHSSSLKLSIDLPSALQSRSVGPGRVRRSSTALGKRSDAGLFQPRKFWTARVRVSESSRARDAAGTSGRIWRSAFVSATCQASSSAEPTVNGYSAIAACKSASVPKHGTGSRHPLTEGLFDNRPQVGVEHRSSSHEIAVRARQRAPSGAGVVRCPFDSLRQQRFAERVETVAIEEHLGWLRQRSRRVLTRGD